MKIVCFGEIMLRLTPPNHQRLAQATSLDVQYGGSEANVAVSLAQFGTPSAYVTRVPDSPLGNAALSELRRYGVDTTPSVFGGERLGAYYLEIGAGARGSRVIYDRAHSGVASLEVGMIDWEIALQNATWLHWSGITPAVSQSAADATLAALKVADKMGITISCDLNYRANLWQYGKTPAQIMPELVELTDVLMGDATAFDLFFDVQGENNQDLLTKVIAKFPKIRYASMTARRGHTASHNTYTGFLFDGKTLFQSREFDIPDILDRIGGGDAFMAGLIYGLSKIMTPSRYVGTGTQYSSAISPDFQSITEFATAAATLKHYVHGDFNLTSVAEVEALMGGNTGGRVSR